MELRVDPGQITLSHDENLGPPFYRTALSSETFVSKSQLGILFFVPFSVPSSLPGTRTLSKVIPFKFFTPTKISQAPLLRRRSTLVFKSQWGLVAFGVGDCKVSIYAGSAVAEVTPQSKPHSMTAFQRVAAWNMVQLILLLPSSSFVCQVLILVMNATRMMLLNGQQDPFFFIKISLRSAA